jgi:ribonuclease G
VHEGKSVYVQVLKDPIGSKGARLTMELSMPSRNLVYLPNGFDIGISQKIESLEERERLHALVSKQISLHELQGGFIIRTLAESASDEDIANDMVFQQRLWGHVSSAMKDATPASLIHEDVPLSLRTMRDLVHDDLEKIRIDSRESFEKAREFAKDFMPELIDKLEYYPGEQPLFGLYSIEQEIESAMHRKVMLKSGGDIIIDQTEAMTTIDVNTGSYVGRRNHEETLFKTNLEAAIEIAHQLRLRNLGGIIIVDFIDMQSSKHKKQVLAALSTSIAKDRVKINVTDISPLGLVEITRKRTRESLEQVMCEACPVCKGRGTIKTIQTVCYEILREILREDRQYKAQAYTIVAAQQVVDLLLDEEANSVADLQEFIDRPISIKADPYYQQQQYDIALA